MKQAILDGTIDNGAQMSTEQQLAATFGVSRITARRAMDKRAAEELVERRRTGQGALRRARQYGTEITCDS
jgi:GntR family transcriptional regulator